MCRTLLPATPTVAIWLLCLRKFLSILDLHYGVVYPQKCSYSIHTYPLGSSAFLQLLIFIRDLLLYFTALG